MQWLVQACGIEDPNALKVHAAVKKYNLQSFDVGVIPFTETITGLEEVDLTKPTMCFGSTGLVDRISKMDIKPGVFYESEWFDPRYWKGKRDDLLNEEQVVVTTAELRDNWIQKPMFAKSVGPKLMTGQVIYDDDKDKDYWIREFCNLNGGDLLVLSPPVKLEKEWRFFIVAGKVVTGSIYRKFGARITSEPIESEVWDIAHKYAEKWMPNSNIVMDIALTQDKEYKVIEFNCINSSGYYEANADLVVSHMEVYYG